MEASVEITAGQTRARKARETHGDRQMVTGTSHEHAGRRPARGRSRDEPFVLNAGEDRQGLEGFRGTRPQAGKHESECASPPPFSAMPKIPDLKTKAKPPSDRSVAAILRIALPQAKVPDKQKTE